MAFAYFVLVSVVTSLGNRTALTWKDSQINALGELSFAYDPKLAQLTK